MDRFMHRTSHNVALSIFGLGGGHHRSLSDSQSELEHLL